MPDISIAIPVHNGEKYIAETIASIQAQEIPAEIIVIDDCSTDASAAIAARMGAIVTRNEKRSGQVASKNNAIRLTTCPYWMTIDQDDKLRPGALMHLLEIMANRPECQILMGHLKDFCSPDTPWQRRHVKTEPFWGILTGAAIFRTAIFRRIGLFRADIHTGEVIDLSMRAEQAGIAICRTNFISCDRRIHDSNFGFTHKNVEYKNYASVLRSRMPGRHFTGKSSY